MLSRFGFSGNAGKGLCSGWLTWGGLDGGIGSKLTYNWVSGAGDCKWCDVDSSGEDFYVSVESEVPSTCSGWRDGGRDRLTSQHEPGVPNCVIPSSRENTFD